MPWLAIAALAAAAVLVLALGAWRRARGLAWRVAAVALIFGDPRQPVAGRSSSARRCAMSRSSSSTNSPSQQIGDRAEATEAALAALTERLGRERDLDVRVVRAGKPSPAPATTARGCSRRSTARCPTCRAGGSPAWSMITDGEVHDVPAGDAKAARRAARRAAARAAVRAPGRGRPPPRRRPGAELRPRRQGRGADRAGRGSADSPSPARPAEAQVTWRKDGGAPHPLMVPVGTRREAVDPDRPRRAERRRARGRARPARADARQQPRRDRRQRRARPAARAAGLGRAACRRAGLAQHPQIRPVGRPRAFHHPAPAGKAGRHADQANCR